MCLSRASRLQRSYDDIKSSSSSTITSLIGITGMESWVKISIILCMFGILKEFRPSEPFITEYLINPPMNFTVEQVYQEIYPVSTYAYLVELIIVFLITDYLRYKPVIILDAISGLIVYILLIFGRSIQAMQAVEIIYGLFMAGEVAYYTYIYAKVDKEHFQAVSSHTRAAYLIGRAISGIVSQVVISAQLLNYYHLQFLTAGGLAVATIWALFLPPVKTSIYFHRNESTVGVSETQERKQENVFVIMYLDLKHAVCDIYVLQLLIWSIISTAGFYQIASYVQVIWNVISKENAEQKQKMLWNGAVETLYTLLGAFGSFMVGKINLPWYKLSEIILAVTALVIAALLYVMSQTNTLWIAYLMYILFMILYHTCITIVNSEIAKNLKKDSYGLIFGVAMFFSLLVQTALTAIIVDKSGLALSPRAQFVVYGAYFNVLSAILFIKIILCAITRFCSGNKEDDVISVSGGEAL